MTRIKKLKIALGIAVVALAGNAGWQVAGAEIANAELQDDMRDVASQLAVRTGMSDLPSDEQLRELVIRKAEKYDIPLSSDQITVERTGYGKDATIYLAADYDVVVRLVAGYSYTMRFSPASNRL